ncbi:MAG: gamma-glutamylcyclotransferase [Clostridiales bacterium]|nr:gamma-glutamylcyclotransferase [Clostridiales bacterium]
MVRKQTKQYYLAYGSNLNLEQMAFRCPGATVAGPGFLEDYRLLFRGESGNTHATVEKAPGYRVPVLAWKISPSNEAALDQYEGYPSYYRKEYVNIPIGGTDRTAMIYVMADGQELGAPSNRYYNVILRGYETSGFDIEILETALRESCEV